MTSPPWKEFEKLAYEIQQELAGGNAVVTLRDTIQGKDSGIPRQIDLSIRQQVGPYSILIIADCKAHQEPIDINIVEQFITAVRDVRANKGALVASRGFTSAALEMARAHGIDTFTLVDTASANWRAYVSIPVLLQRTRLTSFSFIFAVVAADGTIFPAGDPSLFELRAPDGISLGTPVDLLARKWNARELSVVPGRHEVVLTADTRIANGNQLGSVKVSAEINIVQEWYFGHLPVQTRGFQNAQTGGLITRQVTTDFLSPSDIEQDRVPGWRKIDDPMALAVRPVMRLDYSDVLPVSTELGGT